MDQLAAEPLHCVRELRRREGFLNQHVDGFRFRRVHQHHSRSRQEGLGMRRSDLQKKLSSRADALP